MKEQTAFLPKLPIVGYLKLTSKDGMSLSKIEVLKTGQPQKLTPFFSDCYNKIKDFLNQEVQEINIPLDDSELSEFQLKVLDEMKKVPYGETTTYKEIALAIKSKAYQAIGNACGKNPFFLIYPCHRVLGSKDLGGFAHGQKMKKQLLALEGYKSA